MKDVSATIISQYKDSPILSEILSNLDEYIEPSTNLRAFYDMVWNIDTASSYGLDVWGRIVGVSRYILVSTSGANFSFYESGANVPMGDGVFYNGGEILGLTKTALSDATFRKLILMKALANITNCSAPSVNYILAYLFGSNGRCYVIENGAMGITYRFEFTLSASDLAIVQQSGVLPRPSGVAYSIVQG